MKKIIYLFLITTLIGCRSVDDWGSEPVLNESTINRALIYVSDQTDYINLVDKRNSLEIINNLTIEQLDELLKIEKYIALSSQKVVSSWFEFNLELKQDPGFKAAIKGHYYFRKSIEALNYSEKMRKITNPKTIKDNKSYEKINAIESLCRLSIGEIVAYNHTLLEPVVYYKELKKLYNSMD